jgi:hypothetical protein
MGKDMHALRRRLKSVADTKSLTFAITINTQHAEFHKGTLYTAVQLFSTQFDVSSCCIGQKGNRVLAYIRFKQLKTLDDVRSLCITAAHTHGDSATIKVLQSKCRRRNWLKLIYVNDKSLLQDLSEADTNLLTFDELFHAWLESQKGIVTRLDNPFLQRFSSRFAYITSRLYEMNNDSLCVTTE